MNGICQKSRMLKYHKLKALQSLSNPHLFKQLKNSLFNNMMIWLLMNLHKNQNNLSNLLNQRLKKLHLNNNLHLKKLHSIKAKNQILYQVNKLMVYQLQWILRKDNLSKLLQVSQQVSKIKMNIQNTLRKLNRTLILKEIQ